MLNLSRSNGKIYNTEGTTTAPIVLIGGHYNLFSSTGVAARAVVDDDGNPIKRTGRNEQDEMCPPPLVRAKEAPWASWNAFFTSMVNNRINLLRIFLTNGTAMSNGKPVDLFPFNRAPNGLLKVRTAIEAWPQTDNFNVDYFNRLTEFALKADQHNVALQLCLFTHFDFLGPDVDDADYYQSWGQSFWNPIATNVRDWGETNLVNVTGGTRDTRNAYFMDVTKTGLLNVQQKFVERVMRAVSGRRNIIFEIMNEPRGTRTAADMARWSSKVVGWILAAAGNNWRPLISVNASKHTTNAIRFDIDAWKAITPHDPNYDAVDIVSYHGLTGTPGTKGISTCNSEVAVPDVDKPSIAGRISDHFANHGSKALIFSTDGVHHFSHEFHNILYKPAQPRLYPPKLDMHKRDGQIVPDMSNDTPLGAKAQKRLSGLGNWANWTLTEAFKPDRLGSLHFQNHSSYVASFQAINTAH